MCVHYVVRQIRLPPIGYAVLSFENMTFANVHLQLSLTNIKIREMYSTRGLDSIYSNRGFKF